MSNLMYRVSRQCLVVFLLLGAAEAHAQGGESGSVGGGYVVESIRFSDADAVGIESLELVTLPFASEISLPRGIRLRASGAHATGTLAEADGTTSSISGLTDTGLQVDLPVLGDHLVLTAVAVLPTGTATQKEEEASVAGAFAADLFPFRVTNWGSGGGMGLAAATTRSFGRVGVGLGVGYSAAREFMPLESGEAAYRPGDEFHMRGVLDVTTGRTGKLSLQLLAQRYSEDQLAGKNLFQSGDRLSAIASYSFAAGARGRGAVYAGGTHREQGSFLDGSESVPLQDLLIGGARLRLPLGPVVFLPSVDTRTFRSSDGVGQGYLLGAGLGAELAVSRFTFVPTFRSRSGRLSLRQDEESGLSGRELGLIIRIGGSR